MAHTLYDNKVLENKLESILITNLDMNNYLTVDYSLTETPGMKKVVNRYTSTGDVQDLGMGEGNSDSIAVSFTPKEYEVKTTQGLFTYFDEQEMTDPMVVETGLQHLAERLVNDTSKKAIAEFGKAEKVVPFKLTFDGIVDAIAALNLEDETGLFMLINPAHKAALRKALGEDLKFAEGFVRTGYIGSVCGVPVIVSKAVPQNEAYIATKEAVTAYIKKGTVIEQDRDVDTRNNKVVGRKFMVVALTDARKVVKLSGE